MPPTPPEPFTVGWTCALSHELGACRATLDEEYDFVDAQDAYDDNVYRAGILGNLKVVIASLLDGEMDKTSAACVAVNLLRRIPSIRFDLLVGNEGDVSIDIRLGGFEFRAHLTKPPLALLNVAQSLNTDHDTNGHEIQEILMKMIEKFSRLQQDYVYPGANKDRLPRAKCEHGTELNCAECSVIPEVNRAPPLDWQGKEDLQPRIDSFPCLVIRGISDYADCYKRDDWQQYSEAVAATYARELLEVLTAKKVAEMDSAKSKIEHQQFHVPFRVGARSVFGFVGRDAELKELEACLYPDDFEKPHRRIFVAYGLGGIGKTQMALEFARRHRHDYSAIIWLDGSTESSLKKGMAEFAARLLGQGEEIGEYTAEEHDAAVGSVLKWLSLPGNSGWLMILDNVDQDFQPREIDEQAYDVEEYFPPEEQGAILITTRLAALSRLGKSGKIDRVSDAEALRILGNSMNREVDADADVQETLDSLQGLPLALTLAGSYTRDGISFADYNKQYASVWRNLMQSQDKFSLRQHWDRNILTTLRASFDQLRRINDDASMLLLFFSFFARAQISFWLIEPATTLCERMKVPDWLLRIASDRLKFNEATKVLVEYSLIDSIAGTSEYAMHPLIHEWCFEEARGQDQQAEKLFCGLASAIIVHLIPEDDSQSTYWQLRKDLLPHAIQECRRIDQCFGKSSNEERTTHLSNNTLTDLGGLLEELDELTGAAKMYEQALAGFEETLGCEHLAALVTMNNLAGLYKSQDKLREAKKMYKRTLNRCEKSLGPEHVLTLGVLNNLAGIYAEKLGKPDKAEKLFEQAFAGCENFLGRNHVLTHNVLMNHGRLYLSQGKLDEAEKMFKKSLALREEAPGHEHAWTLELLQNLGILYTKQGKLEEAEELLEQALTAHEEMLGCEHASMLDAVYVLAYLRLEQGELDKAEKICARAIAGMEKVLGQEHTRTLEALDIFGGIRLKQGRLEEAEKMFQRALSGKKKIIGHTNPSTLFTAHNLIQLHTQKVYSVIHESPEQGCQDEADSITQSVRSIAHLLAAFTVELDSFNALGRCLLWARDEKNAEIAFQQQHVQDFQNGSIFVEGVKCAGCSSRQISAEVGWYVCSSCKYIQLCDRCFTHHSDGPLSIGDHRFLHVVTDPLDLEERVDAVTWLQGLETWAWSYRYTHAEHG